MPPLSALREESDAKSAEQDRRGQSRPRPGIRRGRSFAREGGGAAQSLRSFLARPPVTCGTGFLLEEGRVARRSARAFAPPPRQAEESRAGRGYVRPPLPARAAVGGEGVWEQGGYGGRQGLARSAPALRSTAPASRRVFSPSPLAAGGSSGRYLPSRTGQRAAALRSPGSRARPRRLPRCRDLLAESRAWAGGGDVEVRRPPSA